MLQALAWLLCVPGASNTVLEVMVPYSRGSMIDVLGQVCSSVLHVWLTWHAGEHVIWQPYRLCPMCWLLDLIAVLFCLIELH